MTILLSVAVAGQCHPGRRAVPDPGSQCANGRPRLKAGVTILILTGGRRLMSSRTARSARSGILVHQFKTPAQGRGDDFAFGRGRRTMSSRTARSARSGISVRQYKTAAQGRDDDVRRCKTPAQGRGDDEGNLARGAHYYRHRGSQTTVHERYPGAPVTLHQCHPGRREAPDPGSRFANSAHHTKIWDTSYAERLFVEALPS